MNTDYLERVNASRGELAGAEIAAINEAYGKLQASAKALGERTIESANLAREIGILFQSWSGHELLDKKFWRGKCGELEMSYDTAQICVSVARRMPQPAANLKEAFPFVRAVHESVQQLEIQSREEMQEMSRTSLIQRFLYQITKDRVIYEKFVEERPMETWTPDALATFISDTEWLAGERVKAEKLAKAQ